MSEGGRVTYTKVTAEPMEVEITTMRELLTVVAEARETVRVEVFDEHGRRHEIRAAYVGETTGVKR